MDVSYKGRNMQVDDELRSYADRKLDRVGRHIPTVSPVMASVQLSREETRRLDQRFSAQITLELNGSVLRSEERAGNARAAIDLAADVLDRRARRLKTRIARGEWAKHTGDSIRFEEPEASATPPPEDEEEAATSRLVRVKRFPVKPMTVEEAMFQMDMLGHDFFLFFNAEDQDQRPSVLYRREDGQFGMIVAEMG